jgi:hypothetical protein
LAILVASSEPQAQIGIDFVKHQSTPPLPKTGVPTEGSDEQCTSTVAALETLAMELTGIKTPVGIKIQGPSLEGDSGSGKARIESFRAIT